MLTLTRMIRFWAAVEAVLKRWGYEGPTLGEIQRQWGRREPELAAAAIARARRNQEETPCPQ